MKKLLSFLLLLSAALTLRADFAKPDFAYPQTVIADAEAELRSATAPSQGLTRLKAILEIAAAKHSQSPDSAYTMPGFIDRMAAAEPDRTVRGLMLLAEGCCYSDLPLLDRKPDMPLLPLPEDVSEWTQEQANYRAAQLLDEAVGLLKPAFKTRLENYSEVIVIPENSKDVFTTLLDFVHCKAMELDDSRRESVARTAFNEASPGSMAWGYWAVFAEPGSEKLMEIYKSHPKGDGAGYVLWTALRDMGYPNNDVSGDAAEQARRAEYKKMIADYRAANPGSRFDKMLEDVYRDLTPAFVIVNFPKAVAPADTFEIVVKHGYAKKYGFNIYRNKMPWKGSQNDRNLTLVKKFEMTGNPEDGFVTDTVRVALPGTGNYTVRTYCDDTPLSRYYFASSLIVTPWLPVMANSDNEFVAVVADINTGKPCRGVTLKAGKTFGTTNAEGYAAFAGYVTNYDNTGLILSDKNGSAYFGRDINIDDFSERANPKYDDSYYNAQLFVDRPVYHPGDSVAWSAVMVRKSYRESKSELMTGTKVMAILFDANHTAVDTLDVVSDKFGRVSGQFYLPEDRLQGQYSISIRDPKRYWGSGRFKVSDFKLPVFEIKDAEVVRDGSNYVLRGSATRYSGAPVPGAAVAVKVENAPIFWRYADNHRKFEYSGTTEADGSFRIEMPADSLGDGNYQAFVTVTAVTADIAESTVRFRSGYPYFVTGNYDGYYDTDSGKPLPVMAYDSRLKAVPLDALWQLKAEDKTVAEGACRIDTTGTVFDWTTVPVGKYTLTVLPSDTTMFAKCEVGEVTLYSTKRNAIPAGVRLLVPVATYNNIEGSTLDINVGTAEAGIYYVITFDAKGKPAVTRHDLKPGFTAISVPLTSKPRQHVVISTVARGEMSTQTVNINLKQPSKKLTLKGESWRDNLVPGSREHWTLHLDGPDGKGMPGAMIATMYNRALDTFGRLEWPDDFNSFLAAPSSRDIFIVQMPQLGYGAVSASKSINRQDYRIKTPRFYYLDDTSVYGFFRNERISVRGTAKTMAVAYGLGDYPQAVNDMSVKMSAKMAAAPMMADAVLEEAAAETEEAADAGAGAMPEGGAQQADNFQYRVAEVLQAFWMPTVSVNADGVATLDFDVPDALGAWTFRATAWTEDCRAASMLATLVSSKPVMVQPSLPRFMRQGDRARVLATVMNRTDSTQVARTVVEIFDPVTDRVISRYEQTDTIAANSQATVGVDLDAATDASAIGYRVRSTAGEFTDGEQNVIPVVEASTIAIDSDVFYLTNKNPEYTATIPADPKGDGIVALQYCNNPVWDAVKALPGMYEGEPRTATSAAASAFAAYTARGLYDKYPEIRRVLDIWQSDPTAKALESKLYDNEDIKLALLAATPFVGSANAQTEQMQRLALTFDKKTIDRTARMALGVLNRLQNADGGFAWGDWSRESSVWMTRSVLMSLGRLNAMGYMPADGSLDRIVDSALAYIDKKVDKDDYNYAWIYSMFPDRKPTTLKSRQAIDAVTQKIVKDWKKMSTAQKTCGALILNATGNKAVAREIMGSVAQFAVANPRAGVSFPSVNSVDTYAQILEAFAKVSPDRAMLDGMRQWLVLKTQTGYDLGAWNPTSLVSAILSTGSRWTADADTTASVTIDGRPLEVSAIEAATGAFSVRLEPSADKRSVTFTRPAGSDQPAYGSVTTVGTRPLSEIAPRGSKQLSITKRFHVEREGKWVETTEFALGERVRVTLMLKADEPIQFVTVRDDRPAAFEPVDQMPGWVYDGSLGAYRENADRCTSLFINNLPKGTWYLTYEMTAAFAGRFVSGTAAVQSQYAPELTARSGASYIEVK